MNKDCETCKYSSDNNDDGEICGRTCDNGYTGWELFVDSVAKPTHYTTGTIECIDAIRSALTEEEFRGYCKGNVLKYTWRERMKGQDEDLKKAKQYIEFMEVK